jgi:acyl-CoA thioesterase-1
MRQDGGVRTKSLLAVGSLFAAGVVVRAFTRMARPPANNPAAFLAGNGTESRKPRTVCLGASTVHGNVSYDVVGELARRLPGHDLVNAGINGQTSAQVLDRLAEVTACAPDHVVVLIGANDLLAIQGTPLGRGNAARLPETPTLDSFARNLTGIVRGLRQSGDPQIALMSIQPLGELLDSDINRAVDQLNAAISRVALEEGVAYLPLNERLKDYLKANTFSDAKAYNGALLPVLSAIVLHQGLGVDLDRIGRMNGYAAHTEGLHLASAGGAIAADLVEEFVAGRSL